MVTLGLLSKKCFLWYLSFSWGKSYLFICCVCGRTNPIVPSTWKQELVVLGCAAAEFTFTQINRVRCSSRTCTMDLALPGSRTRGLRSVKKWLVSCSYILHERQTFIGCSIYLVSLTVLLYLLICCNLKEFTFFILKIRGNKYIMIPTLPYVEQAARFVLFFLFRDILMIDFITLKDFMISFCFFLFSMWVGLEGGWF